MNRLSKIVKMLGPGLLWAGAAVGVSHLVQSTRAGANYGFSLVFVVLFANLLKYPFFEFAPRYASSTGKTLLTGYNELGKWAFYLYLVLTFLTMFTIQAVVTVVTSGVANWFLGSHALSDVFMSGAILLVSALILLLGKYSLLDNLVKYIVIFLTLATFFAVAVAFAHYSPERMSVSHPKIFSGAGIMFMVALIGWMPSAIDISVWSSIWTIEKRKVDPDATTLKNSLFDFNVGYIGTVFIALGFLALGALVMYGSGTHFFNKAALFSSQLISLYSGTIGSWSRYLVGLAALATMFSTTITCLDAYGRVWAKSLSLIKNGNDENESTYFVWMIVTIIGAMVLITILSSKLKMMVDLATTLSFLTAPILGFLNYRVVTSSSVPNEARLPRWLNILSISGLTVLTIFALFYLKIKLFG